MFLFVSDFGKMLFLYLDQPDVGHLCRMYGQSASSRMSVEGLKYPTPNREAAFLTSAAM